MKAYFIGALVGAIIGYITNWLAIKMLFRPHEEKRVWGIKVPFTPGLIPKEKDRIAKSVGETVGEHLLTADVISSALSSNGVKGNLKESVSNKVNELFDKNKSIEEMLKATVGDKYEPISIKFKKKCSLAVLGAIKSESFIESISLKISAKVIDEIKGSPKIIHELVNNKNIRNKIIEFFESYKKSEDFNSGIRNFINNEIKRISSQDKKVNEIMSNNMIEVIESVVYSQKDFIVEELINVLSEGEISNKIKLVINENIPSMVAMFISMDSIYEKVISIVSVHLMKEENKTRICRYIIEFLEKLGEHNVNDILESIPQDKFELITNEVEGLICDRVLNEKNIIECIDKLENYILGIESYHEVLIMFDENYESKINKYILDKISDIINSEELENGIESTLDNTIASLLQTSIKDTVDDKNELLEIIYGIIESRYDDFVKNDASKLIKSINISSLIENQINSFEVSYAEEIILSIAKKELGAITWLGALLGAILGILSPMLANLYM